MEAPQELVAALAAHGEALAAELRALDDMPQVKLTPASVFDRAKPPGSIAQQRGVICKLRCCGRQLDGPEVQRPDGRRRVPDARRGCEAAASQGRQADGA